MKEGWFSIKEGVIKKEGVKHKRLLSTKEGFTPTFSHQAPPKKTPPCHEPSPPCFFYSTQTRTTTSEGRSKGKDKSIYRTTPFCIFIKLSYLCANSNNVKHTFLNLNTSKFTNSNERLSMWKRRKGGKGKERKQKIK